MTESIAGFLHDILHSCDCASYAPVLARSRKVRHPPLLMSVMDGIGCLDEAGMFGQGESAAKKLSFDRHTPEV